MRIRILLAVGALCLGVSLQAEAVPADPGGTVGVAIEQRAPNSLYWDVYLFSAPGAEVGSINFMTTGFIDFAFDASVENVSLLDSAFWPNYFGDGRNILGVVSGGGALGGTDDLSGLFLGTFTAASPSFDSVTIADSFDVLQGDLAYTPDAIPYPTASVQIVLVPESGLTLAVPLLTLALMRRSRAAQHLAG